MNNISTASERLPSANEKKVEWLNHKILNSIEYMRRLKNVNRKNASVLKIVTVAMSGIGSIFLGLQISGFDTIFRNFAFVLVTIVTLVNALEPFFSYRDLWIEQEKALAGFHRVKDNFDFYLAGADIENVDPEKLNQIYKELSDVWNQHNKSWLSHRKTDSPTQYTIL